MSAAGRIASFAAGDLEHADVIATALESVRGYLNWYENGGGAGKALAGIGEALKTITRDAK